MDFELRAVAGSGSEAAPTTAALSTLDSGAGQQSDQNPRPVATLLLHPEARRLGERCSLDGLSVGMPVALSRTDPFFVGLGGGPSRPIDEPHVSRTPLWIRQEGDGLIFSTESSGIRAVIDGHRLEGSLRLPAAKLADEGILLSLGGYVLIWLHMASGPPAPTAWQGIIGLSGQMTLLRERISRLAGVDYPVVLRGESGVGKELVAHALHQAGPRAAGPYITLNIAAVPAGLAAAELFGYERGAFTGANQSRKGRLEQAHGGTLFLDEIGEAPAEVQSQLLRALDSGEIQPLGGLTRKVDVRVITATDADLETLVAEGNFSRALLYRLHSGHLEVPPLRQRRVDIPLLLHYFLSEALERAGAPERLTRPTYPDRPWLGVGVIEGLLGWTFPGNVRELRNYANEIILYYAERRRAELPPDLLKRLKRNAEPKASVGVAAEVEPAEQEPTSLTFERVEAALVRHDWRVNRAAAELGVVRNTLVRFINRSNKLRRPVDIDEPDLRAALAKSGGDVEAAARLLRISAHGLRLRMAELARG